MEWITKNSEWLFSGIGVTVLVGIFALIKGKSTDKSHGDTIQKNIVITQNNGIQDAANSNRNSAITATNKNKAAVNILFVDDDVKFKVVSILKGHGWTGTRIIKDINSLEQTEVASADIFFVDIQGVGKSLQFKDEGLGLVVALKKKYPAKKLVIYSAESGLDPFHQAFRVADDRISKDADPYEFIEVVDRLSS